MKKMKIVDFIIEQFGIEEPECCYSVAAYYTFDHEVNTDDLELSDMAYFNIFVGTSKGLGIYFEWIAKNSNNEIVFFPHVAIVKVHDKKLIMKLIREKLQSIFGKNQSEVIRKAMVYFDWEYQDDEVALNRLFHK